MNEDMQKQLLQMLSQMDKTQVQNGLNKFSSMLNNEDKQKIMNMLNNSNNKN